jgi:hypothetical protein
VRCRDPVSGSREEECLAQNLGFASFRGKPEPYRGPLLIKVSCSVESTVPTGVSNLVFSRNDLPILHGAISQGRREVFKRGDSSVMSTSSHDKAQTRRKPIGYLLHRSPELSGRSRFETRPECNEARPMQLMAKPTGVPKEARLASRANDCSPLSNRRTP